MSRIFITGIGTDVGKTVVSSIITQALEADYFKPIQAGDLDYTDTDKVKEFVSNKKTKFHQSFYSLKTPMSPHAAAIIDNINIKLENIVFPDTKNLLIVEGAGGILVPINNTETILDLVQADDKVVIVSRHYLGSINHSLLTLKALEEKNSNLFLWFNGDKHPSTEDIIKTKYPNIPIIGRINKEIEINKSIINRYADQYKKSIIQYLS